MTSISYPSVVLDFVISPSLLSFNLPKLQEDIPINATFGNQSSDIASLGLALVRAGVISPEDIPESVVSPQDIVEAGLVAWFDKHLPMLDILRFDMMLLDEEKTLSFYNEFECPAERNDPTGFSLYISGNAHGHYELKNSATRLESVIPGLFKTAFNAIKKASSMTIDIFNSVKILYAFESQWEYWDYTESDGDIDDQIRTSLEERFGDSEEVERQMPREILPLLGGSFCHNDDFGPEIAVAIEALRPYAQLTTDTFSSAVALLTAELIDAINAAKLAGAKMPDMNGINAVSVERSCYLLFESDDRVIQEIDYMINGAYETGESTDCIGIGQLPTSESELKKYFKDLELSLTVIYSLDKLLNLIAYSSENEE